MPFFDTRPYLHALVLKMKNAHGHWCYIYMYPFPDIGSRHYMRDYTLGGFYIEYILIKMRMRPNIIATVE